MKPKRTCAPIGAFREHPAQMRTIYEVDDMAELTLQVYENGLSDWQPIVATPDGKGGYFIISGHRRSTSCGQIVCVCVRDVGQSAR